jgi:glutamate-1-semialdehyde 2,1-aminomutase
MAAFDPRAGGLTHGGTFNNNAFTMAVGAAVHETLIDAATLTTVNKRGDALRDALGEVFGDSPLPFSATGWGSFVNVHPVPGPVRRPADLRGADLRWRELFFFELLEAGFYLAPRGYLALTMDVTDGDVDRFLAAVGEFCRRHAALCAPAQ